MGRQISDNYCAWYCDWCDSRNLVKQSVFSNGRVHCAACSMPMPTGAIEVEMPARECERRGKYLE